MAKFQIANASLWGGFFSHRNEGTESSRVKNIEFVPLTDKVVPSSAINCPSFKRGFSKLSIFESPISLGMTGAMWWFFRFLLPVDVVVATIAVVSLAPSLSLPPVPPTADALLEDAVVGITATSVVTPAVDLLDDDAAEGVDVYS